MKKSIGLDIPAPKETCTDAKCVWHGRLPVRGKAITGIVRSTKSHNTTVVEWRYNKFLPKFESYERRKIRIAAYNPSCIKVREGEQVVVAECRSLSKTKSFVVVGALRERP